jgi:hypothetical protein
LGSTPTAPSKLKPSTPDEIVELKPPPDLGFSGTRKFYAKADSVTVAELMRRGYTVVEPA